MEFSDVDEVQATEQISAAESALREIHLGEADDIRSAKSALCLARAFLKVGDYKKAFLLAVRARRMLVERQTVSSQSSPVD